MLYIFKRGYTSVRLIYLNGYDSIYKRRFRPSAILFIFFLSLSYRDPYYTINLFNKITIPSYTFKNLV